VQKADAFRKTYIATEINFARLVKSNGAEPRGALTMASNDQASMLQVLNPQVPAPACVPPAYQSIFEQLPVHVLVLSK
jgi:hypothetical protein